MFRELLIESVPQGARGTGVGFPISVAVHALLIATAVVLSGWAVQEPPDPDIPTIFQVLLPAPAGSAASRNSPAESSQRTGQALQPGFRPALPVASPLSSVIPVPSSDSTDGGGDAVGDAEGGGGTVPGGIGTDPLAAGRGEGPPIPIGGDVRPNLPNPGPGCPRSRHHDRRPRRGASSPAFPKPSSFRVRALRCRQVALSPRDPERPRRQSLPDRNGGLQAPLANKSEQKRRF
jgi:hypothetical protein